MSFILDSVQTTTSISDVFITLALESSELLNSTLLKNKKVPCESLYSQMLKLGGLLATNTFFIESIVKHRKYTPNLFTDFKTLVLGYGITNPEIVEFLENKIKIYETILSVPVEEKVIPEDLLDPLMYELITDPLILPGNDMVIDRKVIERHLLSDETNPFTRETLTFELLKEYNEKPEIHEKLEQLKLRIAEFI
jgi:hypothetical protein